MTLAGLVHSFLFVLKVGYLLGLDWFASLTINKLDVLAAHMLLNDHLDLVVIEGFLKIFLGVLTTERFNKLGEDKHQDSANLSLNLGSGHLSAVAALILGLMLGQFLLHDLFVELLGVLVSYVVVKLSTLGLHDIRLPGSCRVKILDFPGTSEATGCVVLQLLLMFLDAVFVLDESSDGRFVTLVAVPVVELAH